METDERAELDGDASSGLRSTELSSRMSDNDDEGGRDIAGGEVIMPTTVTSESSKVTEVPTGMLKGMSIISSAAQETAKTMKATSDKFETVILHTDPTLE